MAEEESRTSSAVPPRAGTLALAELNQRSALCGQWDVGIFHPRVETWTYGNPRKAGAAFKCILVSLSDPTAYVAANVTMKNG